MNGKKSVGEGYNASKGIQLAIEQLNGLNSDNRKSILLFCSGTKLDDMEDVVEMAKKFDIPITTVNIVNDKYSAVLKNIAEETGGTYLDISGYNFSSRDDLYKIANMTLDAFSYIANRENIDTDGDGIPDMYEVLGVKATNGQVLYSDPNKADMDGDGLTDGEELNVKKNKKTEEVVAFVCSDPRYKDSDGDSYTDYDELTKYKSNPYKNEVKLYRWNKGYINVDYEGGKNKNWSDGMVSYGGAQRWFFNEDKKKWYSWFTDDYILENKGCGLISASDILLYLSEKNSKYATKLTKSVEKNKTGNLKYSTYMSYLYNMSDKYFTVGRYTGIFGTSIATGINLYSYKYDLGLKAKWGVKKNQILPKIKEMLKNDIPVTLSIGPCVKNEGVELYEWNPKEGDKYHFDLIPRSNKVASHYVTVTGLVTDKVKNQTMIEISSWGTKYYIDFEEYISVAKNYSNFIVSNIVYITR